MKPDVAAAIHDAPAPIASLGDLASSLEQLRQRVSAAEYARYRDEEQSVRWWYLGFGIVYGAALMYIVMR